METDYKSATIGQTEMLDNAAEFSKTAIDDSILTAADRVIRAIAFSAQSPYRKDFKDVTDTLSSGQVLPTHSQSGAPIVGVIGTVRDAATHQECELADDGRSEIRVFNSVSLLTAPLRYWDDGERIWHTSPNGVVCDVVVWEKDAERAWLAATPTRGDCNFSEDLHEALITGALSLLFRGTFNDDQADAWSKRFETSLMEIRAGGRPSQQDAS